MDSAVACVRLCCLAVPGRRCFRLERSKNETESSRVTVRIDAVVGGFCGRRSRVLSSHPVRARSSKTLAKQTREEPKRQGSALPLSPSKKRGSCLDFLRSSTHATFPAK